MGWLLVAVGVILIGVAIFQIATSYHKETRDVSGQIQNLQTNKFSTDMNRFAAMKEVKPSEKRTKLAVQLKEEALATASLGEAQATAMAAEDVLANAPARLQEVRQREEATHNNQIAVINEATKRKVSIVALDLMIQEEHKTNESIRLKEAESQLNITEHQRFAVIDVQKDYDVRINQLKAVLALKIFPYMKLAEIRGQIKNLLLEDAEVADSNLSASVKAEYRMLLQDTIVVYRRTYERGLGLLQSADGQDVGRTDLNAQLGSGVEDPD